MNSATRIPLIPAEEQERRERRLDSALGNLWDALDAVKDPEIPAISIWELGILQDINLDEGRVTVTITPTYSGCPAMGAIAEEIIEVVSTQGYAECEVVHRLSPAWSTTWITPAAQEQLREYGIAPPGCGGGGEPAEVSCPRCGSTEVRNISEFGSTACKALYQCASCAEPFDHFKPI